MAITKRRTTTKTSKRNIRIKTTIGPKVNSNR